MIRLLFSAAAPPTSDNPAIECPEKSIFSRLLLSSHPQPFSPMIDKLIVETSGEKREVRMIKKGDEEFTHSSYLGWMSSPIFFRSQLSKFRFNAFEKSSMGTHTRELLPFFFCCSLSLFKWYLLFHMGFLTPKKLSEPALAINQETIQEHENTKKHFLLLCLSREKKSLFS